MIDEVFQKTSETEPRLNALLDRPMIRNIEEIISLSKSLAETENYQLAFKGLEKAYDLSTKYERISKRNEAHSRIADFIYGIIDKTIVDDPAGKNTLTKDINQKNTASNNIAYNTLKHTAVYVRDLDYYKQALLFLCEREFPDTNQSKLITHVNTLAAEHISEFNYEKNHGIEPIPESKLQKFLDNAYELYDAIDNKKGMRKIGVMNFFQNGNPFKGAYLWINSYVSKFKKDLKKDIDNPKYWQSKNED